jgi:hypothetical protein
MALMYRSHLGPVRGKRSLFLKAGRQDWRPAERCKGKSRLGLAAMLAELPLEPIGKISTKPLRHSSDTVDLAPRSRGRVVQVFRGSEVLGVYAK